MCWNPFTGSKHWWYSNSIIRCCDMVNRTECACITDPSALAANHVVVRGIYVPRYIFLLFSFRLCSWSFLSCVPDTFFTCLPAVFLILLLLIANIHTTNRMSTLTLYTFLIFTSMLLIYISSYLNSCSTLFPAFIYSYLLMHPLPFLHTIHLRIFSS